MIKTYPKPSWSWPARLAIKIPRAVVMNVVAKGVAKGVAKFDNLTGKTDQQ